MGKERDTNAALKSVRRAKYLLEQTKKSVPELQARIEEMIREVEKEESIEKKQRTQLEELKMDRDILLNSILKQEDIEKATADTVKQLMHEKDEMEAELDRLIKQENNLNREIYDLSSDRDIKVCYAMSRIVIDRCSEK